MIRKTDKRIQILKEYLDIDFNKYLKINYKKNSIEDFYKEIDESKFEKMKQGRSMEDLITNVVISWILEDFCICFLNEYFSKYCNKKYIAKLSGNDKNRTIAKSEKDLRHAQFFDIIVVDIKKNKIIYNIDVAGDFYNNIKDCFSIRETKYYTTKRYVETYKDITTLHLNLNIKESKLQLIDCCNLEEYEDSNIPYKKKILQANKIKLKKEFIYDKNYINYFLKEKNLA